MSLPLKSSPLKITDNSSVDRRKFIQVGGALAVGTLLLVCWIIAAATGERAFDDIQAFNASLIGKLLLFGWSFALFYHLCNGIRHLFWDAGKGFGLEAAYRNGWLVVVASIALTVLSWVWGYASMGALL